MSLGLLLAILGAYALLMLALGVVATRRASSSPEEYFLAGRGLGVVVLFMALFGTNTSSFLLIGIPGQSFREGIAVFSSNAPILALVVPVSFLVIGLPARRMGSRLGALTPAELIAKRFGSPFLGRLLFAAYTLCTLPYMVTAVKGAAVALETVTEGGIPHALGSACVLAVALAYTTLGGMRATAWTNVVQGMLFLGFLLVVFFAAAQALGGFEAANRTVEMRDAKLFDASRGRFSEPRAFASWSLAISLTVIAFPHMLVRLMAAKDEHTLRRVCTLYPIALSLLWVPAVMLGIWATALVPELSNATADQAFPRVVAATLPAWASAIGLLAVLAAVMSTLDAQILTLGSMLERDVLRIGSERAVGRSRAFVVLVALVVYIADLAWGRSVFETARVSFSAYVCLVPTIFLCVRWRKFRPRAAAASLVLSLATVAWLELQGLRPLGFLSAAWGFAIATVIALVASIGSTASESQQSALAFGAEPRRS